MPAGAPTKLTPETTEKLCRALKAGNTRRAACQYAGISQESFSVYLKDNDFLKAIMAAESECEVGFVAVIKKCALKGDWKSATWWLTHHPSTKHEWMQVSPNDLKYIPTETLLAALGARTDTGGADTEGSGGTGDGSE